MALENMQDYAHALGERLRSIRVQQGLSLHAVENKSRGRLKAVVLGSYERAERAITIEKLAELAEVYGVPAAVLLPPEIGPRGAEAPCPTLVIDLQQLAAPLARYAAAISIKSQRGDPNGRF